MFLRHVFNELHLIQDYMPPPSPQEMALVFHQQLVGRHAHMEAVGSSPPLRMNESIMFANLQSVLWRRVGASKRIDTLKKKQRKKMQ